MKETNREQVRLLILRSVSLLIYKIVINIEKNLNILHRIDNYLIACFSKSGRSISSQVIEFISCLPCSVIEKSIWRLSSLHRKRLISPFFSAEAITLEVVDDVIPNDSPISPEESFPFLVREQSTIPSLRQMPKRFSKVCSNSITLL